MRTIRHLAASNAILLLFVVTTGTVFGQVGRPGAPGTGGLGLVNPSGYGELGYGYGFGFGGRGYGGGFGAWFPGYPNSPYQYESGQIPTPPYFAIHPPVYYGKRVGMPYGNSTVTRPPREVVDFHPMVQQVAHVMQPLMILNPYAGEVSEVTEDSSTAEPAEIAEDQVVTVEQPAVEKQPKKKAEQAKKAKESSRSRQKSRKPRK